MNVTRHGSFHSVTCHQDDLQREGEQNIQAAQLEMAAKFLSLHKNAQWHKWLSRSQNSFNVTMQLPLLKHPVCRRNHYLHENFLVLQKRQLVPKCREISDAETQNFLAAFYIWDCGTSYDSQSKIGSKCGNKAFNVMHATWSKMHKSVNSLDNVLMLLTCSNQVPGESMPVNVLHHTRWQERCPGGAMF